MRLARRGQIHRLLVRYQQADVTYPEVGATRGQLPAGYRHTRRRTALGTGRDVFVRASAALLSWEMHRRSGLAVAAEGAAATGATVVLGFGPSPALVVPCRVVYEVDEPDRRGFAYGSLPDHPECGEESFVVTIDDARNVWLEITAFSSPGAALVRVAGPIARGLQGMATRRYERTLAEMVTA
ncbi:MAG TPA: DUF1990 domain-containing protein [Mycobacteriales bacterium]|nr:DUF1990 domain-containing protein [Mycobacteriales bacterium]